MRATTDIEQALIARMREFTYSPDIDVAWPDEEYKPRPGREYIEVQVSFGDTTTPYVGNDDPVRLQGFLLVTAVYPRLHGVNWGGPIADALIEHFRKGTSMIENGRRVQVIRMPWANGPFRDEAWMRIPVTVPYLSTVNPNT